jgi:hypothetical protein
MHIPANGDLRFHKIGDLRTCKIFIIIMRGECEREDSMEKT